MAYIHVYSTRINWENEPSIVSPINATNLNKMDYALKAMDDTFGNWDISKANESDLLLALKDVSYDTDTGVFVFTWFNGTTSTIDLNIEKIPVSFSMDANGVITMTTEDGTTYTADVGALIKTYTFTDSSVIDFTVTTDASGNKTVTADIVNGSIDGTKLVPNYLADCASAKTLAETAASDADDSSEDAEAWAVGERDGVPVPSTDPTYHNNAKYWAQQSGSSTFASLDDVSFTNLQNGQVAIYNSTSQKWENGAQSGGAQIDDTTTSATKVWSSNKTNTELSGKASSSDLSALSTTVTNNNTAQNNKHKVTSKQVATTGWTSTTTAQSGVTLYKKTIALSHVYVTSPIVDIGASGVLPTTAQQEAYDLLSYVTINGTTLTLYSSAIPSTAYYINITGVD